MDQKNRNRSLYTRCLIGWLMISGLIPMNSAQATVTIEADTIVIDHTQNLITASGNVGIKAADLQAKTPYIQYNYGTDSVSFSGESSIQYKQNHLKGSDFMVKLRENSVVSSEKSTITVQLD